MLTNYKGQSVVEIIIAVSLMIIIAGGAVVAMLGAFSSNRLANEETRATNIASEGIEAVQSIRNQSWSNLANGTFGLSNAGGVWEFSGSSDFDPSGKYERSVEISSVRRDLADNITSGSGFIDPDTKLVKVTVAWDFTPARRNDVSLTTYMTNWQEALDPASAAPPEITNCNDLCVSELYTSGICRKSASECSSRGETNEPQGDQFCTTAPNDTCCCLP